MCCRPMRGALLPTPPAEARPHQHRDRSAARASKRRGHCVQIPWRAPARFSPGGVSADRPRSTRRAVCISWQYAIGMARGCVVGRSGARFSPRRRPGLNCTNTATGRWNGLRNALSTAFESRGARPARFSQGGVSTDRPRSTRSAQCGLGLVVLWANAGRAPPAPLAGARAHLHHDSSVARASNSLFHGVRILWRAARALFARCSIDRPPTEHARRAVRTWNGCGLTWGALLLTPSAGA